MRGRDELVAQLTGNMEAALEGWARSLSVEELAMLTGLGKGEVRVSPDSTLVFDPEKPEVDLELPRLRRMLINISNHAHDVSEYLAELHGHDDEDHEDAIPPSGRKYAMAMRKLFTMRDSALELSKLVNGEDLDEGEQPDLPETFTVDSLTEEQKQEVHRLAEVVPHDPFAPVETETLKLAQVHRQIRELQSMIPNDHFTADGAALHGRINRITEYIRSK